MDDLKDQSVVSATTTNGVVELQEARVREALLGDIDPSLTSADDVAKALNIDPSHGLSEEEAKRRLIKFGPNELTSAPPTPKRKKFLAQFQDPPIYLLIVAIIISVIAWFIEKANAQPSAEGGEMLPLDAIVIISILIVNAVLDYIQGAKAEATIEALAQMTAPQISVPCDGKVIRINTADVVPGDIITFAEGDSVSADGRLINATSLRITETSLTDEFVPVGKGPDTLTEARTLGDRANMVFNGTSVTQGTGRVIVTGIGMNAQVDKITDMLSATENEKTPLQKEIDHVSRIPDIAICVIAVVVLMTLAVLEGFNDVHDVIGSLLLTVSLTVAAAPGNLAAILTMVLALGVQRMTAHNAIAKKLHSVEILGSASVICSGKIGTLTHNEMTVERVATPSGEAQTAGTGYAPEGRMAMTGGVSPESEQAQIVADKVVATLVADTLANDDELCEENDRWETVGDPTEVSLIMAAREVKADHKTKRYTRAGEIPFASEHRHVSIITRDNIDSNRFAVFAKGAPDVLLSYYTCIRVGGQARELIEGDRQSIFATAERLSSEAYRTLDEVCHPLKTGSLADVPGVSTSAVGQISSIADQAEATETDLIWNGMVGTIDPPRTEVHDSTTETHHAGIRTVMITDDHPLTAVHIASDLGIIAKDGKASAGDQLDQLPDETTFDKATSEVSVYVRMAPEHKLKIVESLQRQGNIVAVTGDGVNDAPVAKSADIGVTMGIIGIEAAKQNAKMTLVDDNFSTVAATIREGRMIFDNIRKFLCCLLSSNVGKAFTVSLGMVFTGFLGIRQSETVGVTMPLLAIQSLWVNLLTDAAPALAIGVNSQTDDVVGHKPHKAADRVIDASMWGDIIYTGAITAIVALIGMGMHPSDGLFTDRLVDTIGHEAQMTGVHTMGFTILVSAQLFNTLSSCLHLQSAFAGLFFNKWLWGAIGLSVALQLVVIYVSFLNGPFGTVVLSLMAWVEYICLAVIALIASELCRIVLHVMAKR